MTAISAAVRASGCLSLNFPSCMFRPHIARTLSPACSNFQAASAAPASPLSSQSNISEMSDFSNFDQRAIVAERMSQAVEAATETLPANQGDPDIKVRPESVQMVSIVDLVRVSDNEGFLRLPEYLG